MRPRSTVRASRRAFLKFGAVAVGGALAAATAQPHRQLPALAASLAGLRVQSALPWPGLPQLAFPEQLLHMPPGLVEAALVPAYVGAMLIRAGRLQPLRGPTGRAHDPEGHYTLPFTARVAALRYPDEASAPRAGTWADWRSAGRAEWPAFGRLMAGAALLRRGHSPNDTHPGHLAQAAADLARWPAQIAQLVLVDPDGLGQADGLRLPAEGTLLIEYDWVVTASPARAGLARQFIDSLRAAAQPLRVDLPVRLIPLMPLPAAAHAQHSAMWASAAG